MQQHTLHDLQSQNSVQYKVLHRVHSSKEQHMSTSPKLSQCLALCTIVQPFCSEVMEKLSKILGIPLLGDLCAFEIAQQLKPLILIALTIAKNWKDRAYLSNLTTVLFCISTYISTLKNSQLSLKTQFYIFKTTGFSRAAKLQLQFVRVFFKYCHCDLVMSI